MANHMISLITCSTTDPCILIECKITALCDMMSNFLSLCMHDFCIHFVVMMTDLIHTF